MYPTENIEHVFTKAPQIDFLKDFPILGKNFIEWLQNRLGNLGCVACKTTSTSLLSTTVTVIETYFNHSVFDVGVLPYCPKCGTLHNTLCFRLYPKDRAFPSEESFEQLEYPIRCSLCHTRFILHTKRRCMHHVQCPGSGHKRGERDLCYLGREDHFVEIDTRIQTGYHPRYLDFKKLFYDPETFEIVSV